jgi:hypothetical protein
MKKIIVVVLLLCFAGLVCGQRIKPEVVSPFRCGAVVHDWVDGPEMVTHWEYDQHEFTTTYKDLQYCRICGVLRVKPTKP